MFAAVRQLPVSVLVLALAVGCSQSPSGNSKIKSNAKPCAQDSDCSDDGSQVCRAGSCASNSCTSDADCATGQTCSPLSSECVTPDGGTNPDGGSDAGTSCQNKDDCNFGQACNNGTCGVPPGTCGEDLQCGRGQICNFNQQCVTGCDNDQDCAPPQTCNTTAFTCEGGPDAGPDAGPGGCTRDQDCSGNSANPVCDTGIGQCVQCTGSESGACTVDQTCVADSCSGGGGTCPTSCDTTCQNQGFSCDPIGCGCTSNNGSCSDSSQCTSEESCVTIFSVCAKNCTDDSDCPSGQMCCQDALDGVTVCSTLGC